MIYSPNLYIIITTYYCIYLYIQQVFKLMLLKAICCDSKSLRLILGKGIGSVKFGGG